MKILKSYRIKKKTYNDSKVHELLNYVILNAYKIKNIDFL